MELIKQINFSSQRKDFPKELVKKLEFEDSPSWYDYQKKFIIAPKGFIPNIATKIFAEELENIFKNAGYKNVLSQNGFYSSEPERFVLDMRVSGYECEYLQEGSKKMPGFINRSFNLKAPIFKQIPLRAEDIKGKVFSDEINSFKNPEKILNCLKNAGYDAHYEIKEKPEVERNEPIYRNNSDRKGGGLITGLLRAYGL